MRELTRSSLKNEVKSFQVTFSPNCTKEWNQVNNDFKKIDSIQKSEKNTNKDQLNLN